MLDVENFKFWKYVSAKSFLCRVKYLKIKNKASIASSSSSDQQDRPTDTHNRRSVENYKSPASKDSIMTALKCAIHAPNHFLTEP